MKNQLPQVAIVGRANVGKSTLFNRLVEKNKALVSALAGTTRDRNIDVVDWQGKKFRLVDTGGLDVARKHPDEIEINIVKQAEKAIDSAQLILFLVDAKDGLLPLDRELAQELVKKNLKHKIMLVANKADSLKWRQNSQEFYRLGLGEPLAVSAANGSGVGDLLDLMVEKLKLKISSSVQKAEKKALKIAIVGKPNVGKSSLLNAILGEERVMVSAIPHTTREAHDTEFSYGGRDFILIDTAGLRKAGKITPQSLERKSADKSLLALQTADLIILVTEAQKNLTSQDKKITEEILDSGKPLIIAANKWDLIPDKETNTVNDYVKYYQAQFPYLAWAPIIFISAKEKLRAKKILDLALQIEQAGQRQISDSQLEKFLKTKIKQHRPARGRGLKNPYIYAIKQIGVLPPRFCLYVNDPTILHFSYIRFLQNHLREKFQLLGTPIQIEVKKWSEKKLRQHLNQII